MSLEDAILKLVAATEANTAAVLAAGGSPAAAPAAAPAADKAAGKGKKTETPAAAPAAPKITRDEVNAALEQVREKFGVEEAKKIISGEGKAPKRADIAEENFKAVYDACKAKMEGGEEDM